MKSFNILKKNRKYFAALMNNKYKCKIVIDENSENLELGEQEIEVDDISVKTKYGTDLIFKLTASIEDIKSEGICTLRVPLYNRDMDKRCHELDGKWDGQEKAWVFSGIVEDEVELLDEKYGSELIAIEVLLLEDLERYEGPVYLAGFRIAEAQGRDSGASAENGVSIIKGSVSSGGSMKNWKTKVDADSVLRMQIPLNCYHDFEAEEGIEVKKL